MIVQHVDETGTIVRTIYNVQSVSVENNRWHVKMLFTDNAIALHGGKLLIQHETIDSWQAEDGEDRDVAPRGLKTNIKRRRERE